MTSNTAEGPKPHGKASDDVFDNIGNKAEKLSSHETTANGVDSTHTTQPQEDQRIVDEIESLCMNCRENASSSEPRMCDDTNMFKIGHYETPPHSNPLLPRNHNHVLLLSTLQL